MYSLLPFLIAILVLIGLGKLYVLNKAKIDFYFRGIDEGFSLMETNLLWNTSSMCNLEEPVSIFYSVPSLTRCISHLKSKAEAEGTINEHKNQYMLTRLYQFRSKIEKEADKKRGLDSTRYLTNHQKLRIIFPGKGVFSSEIINNGKSMIIRMPTQKGQIIYDGKHWVGQSINVYLWRSGDARYIFDTKVNGEGIFLGHPCLFLDHTAKLVRTQKRNAIRAKCHIIADLYLIKEHVVDYNAIDTKAGLKCLLEDISEKGALIRIGGKGIPNIQIKLQFQLDNRLIVMFGIVRTVEYNGEIKQSRLHFECIHIEEPMKNIVLSYVYKILPENEKEIYDAISLTDTDKSEDSGEKQETGGKLNSTIMDTDKVLYDGEELDKSKSQMNSQINFESFTDEIRNDEDIDIKDSYNDDNNKQEV